MQKLLKFFGAKLLGFPFCFWAVFKEICQNINTSGTPGFSRTFSPILKNSAWTQFSADESWLCPGNSVCMAALDWRQHWASWTNWYNEAFYVLNRDPGRHIRYKDSHSRSHHSLPVCTHPIVALPNEHMELSFTAYKTLGPARQQSCLWQASGLFPNPPIPGTLRWNLSWVHLPVPWHGFCKHKYPNQFDVIWTYSNPGDEVDTTQSVSKATFRPYLMQSYT